MPGAYLMYAKFAGTCPRCGYRIEVGSGIFYDPVFKKAWHRECPQPSYNGSRQQQILDRWVDCLTAGKERANARVDPPDL